MASDLSSLAALCTPTSFLGVAINRGDKPSRIKWTDSIALEPLEAWVADHLHEFPNGSVTAKACEPVFTALNLGASSTMYDKRNKKTLQDRVQNRLRTIVNATRIKAKADEDGENEDEDEDDADSTNTEAPPLVLNSSRDIAPYPSLVEYDEDEDEDGDRAAFFYKSATSMHYQEPHRAISSDASPSQPSLWLRQHPDPSATLAHSKSGVSTGAAWAQNAPAEIEQTPPSAAAPYPSKDTGSDGAAFSNKGAMLMHNLEPRHAISGFDASRSTPAFRLHQRPDPSGALAHIKSGTSTGAAWAQNAPAKVEQTPPSALRTRGRTEAEEQRAAHDMGKMLAAAAAAAGEKKAAEAAARSRANEKRAQLNALFRDFFAQHGHHHHDAPSPSARQAQILVEEFQDKTRKAVDEFNRAELERMELWHDWQMARVARIFCTRN